MPPDDDTPPKRPRWVAWALIAVMALVVLGMLNLGWRMFPAAVRGADAGAQGTSDTAPAPTMALPGRAAVEGGDCLRCHGMDRNYVGPSFRQIAERYRTRADAADYLARKIREGGVGEWGRTVMPRQPQVTDVQARRHGAVAAVAGASGWRASACEPGRNPLARVPGVFGRLRYLVLRQTHFFGGVLECFRLLAQVV